MLKGKTKADHPREISIPRKKYFIMHTVCTTATQTLLSEATAPPQEPQGIPRPDEKWNLSSNDLVLTQGLQGGISKGRHVCVAVKPT